jgi:hypothetical protein
MPRLTCAEEGHEELDPIDAAPLLLIEVRQEGAELGRAGVQVEAALELTGHRRQTRGTAMLIRLHAWLCIIRNRASFAIMYMGGYGWVWVYECRVIIYFRYIYIYRSMSR